MSLSAGVRLGPYEIVAPLGQGGMGAVYRATDTRLNRSVAIKAMHATGALDPDHVARFEREAQLLASLNHPHIAAIHGLETVEATTYLVLEFVDGRPLSEVLRDGALPLNEALPIARQIADALAATHERGIIHRDLKPGNIMVTPDGQVKVLDFGLGKALDSSGTADAAAYGQANSPTMTMAATQAGIILGTAGYMSPEQAKGRNADKRSDVWAFGCVLFEMLSGRRAFEGEDITETLAAIVRGEPDWSALPATTPPAIRTLIERCLIKNRADRLPDMSVVKFVLNEPAVPTLPAGAPLAGGRRVSLPLAVAMVAAGAFVTAALILAVGGFGRSPATESPRAVQLQVLPPDGFASSGVNGGWTVVAPDGSALLMTSSAGLWLRSLESGETRLIPDTAGATYPFWSADSQDIAFFSQGKLKRMAARGGPVVDICPAADSRGGSWNRDDVILFAPGLSTGLYQVSANGGTPAVVVEPTPGASGEYIRYPSFLPDGKHFLFQRSAPQESGFYVGSLDGAPARLLRPFTSSAVYAPPSGGEQMGRLLFLVNETTLMSQPFDLGTLQLAGAMSPVAEGVTVAGQSANGAFSVSASGMLVYASVGGLTSQMMLFDRLGRQDVSIGSPINNPTAVLSKDGRQVMYVPAFSGMFLQQISGGPPTQVAEGGVYFAAWSRDGRVAFSKSSGVGYDLFIKHLDGAAEEEPLGVSAMNAGVTDWSADDKWIAYQATDNDTAADIWVLPLTGDRTPVAFLKTRDQEAFGRFSPDSRWMAYVQVVSGTPEVFVQSISASGSAAGIKFRISSAGSALGPVSWRSDGRELIYASRDQKVISVPVTLGATVETGSPQVLFPLPDGAELLDMSGDAQRFLVAVPAGAGAGARANALTVIMNWQAGLKK